MSILRRILGILVMIAGILGLVLAIAGLIAVWAFKPAISQGAETTLSTLTTSIDTSQQAMVVTEQALQGTIDSVSALQVMLEATATSVSDSMPFFEQLIGFLGKQLPATLDSASTSLLAAQQGAQVMDSAVRSFENFKSVMRAVPFFGGLIDAPETTYNPETPLADSLGEVAANLQDLPDRFTEMSASLDTTDNNLVAVESSLSTMATSVGTITSSLEEYKAMVSNSQASLENLQAMLDNLLVNLENILNTAALVTSLLLAWMLAAQVVILSQGWELYQGTAGRMAGGSSAPEPPATATPPDAGEQPAEPPAAIEQPAEPLAAAEPPAGGAGAETAGGEQI